MRLLTPILRRLILAPWRVAVVDDQRTWRAWQLYVAALHVARAVERATDRPHVGMMLPTSGLSPVAIIATWLLGRTIVPLNYLLTPEILDDVCADAGLDTVITVGPMLEHVSSATGGGLPERVQALRLDELSYGGLPPLRRAARRDDDHLAALVYTSGTSGRPKGVMLTAGSLAANVEQCIEWADFDRRDVIVGVLPQFHSFGLTVLTLLPLTVGAKVVYTARFMPKRLLGLLERHRPTVMLLIPSMYGALLSAKSATPEHFASLRLVVSGSEPLPASIAQGYRDRFGITINEGYGLTETGPVTNWCRPHEHRPRSVGKALPRVEQRIVGPDGDRLGPGADGEIRINGPNVMRGYYNRPEETAAAFDEQGFFRTGDMGHLDEDGHLYITGRLKEMLIIGGENVFPREIEEVLNRHPDVHASAVVGLPDDARGEVALAFVELEDGATFDEAALRSHCRADLPQYKVPREIRVLERLPRSPTGKVLRRELGAGTPSSA